MKLLLLEDTQNDIDVCNSSVETYNDGKAPEHQIQLVVAKTTAEARNQMNEDYDGAIIDLRISADPLAGNQIVEFINELNLRTPVAIFTGTPDAASLVFSYIGKFRKGETTYNTIFELFADVKQTGLLKIMGRRGIIENCLNEVYQKDIIPTICKWKEHAKMFPQETERALGRHTLSHLFMLLAGDSELYFPEECYLHSKKAKFPRTGEIIQDNATKVFFAIITPPCDLEVRTDKNVEKINVEKIQIVPFVAQEVFRDKAIRHSKPTPGELENWARICNNQSYKYLHYLPQINDFNGGFLNFREVKTISIADFSTSYSSVNLLISPDFFKDILSRFSGYYARQGQPSIRL